MPLRTIWCVVYTSSQLKPFAASLVFTRWPGESSGRLLAPPVGMRRESTLLTRCESGAGSDSFIAVDHLCDGA